MIIDKVLKSDQEIDVHGTNPRLTTFLNPISYWMNRNNDALQNFHNIHVDGILLVLIFRLFGHKVTRRSFDMTSIAPAVFEACSKSSSRIVTIGGTEEEAVLFNKQLATTFPSLDVVSYSGFQISVEDYLRELKRAEPGVVLVGMGAPLQENIALALYREFPAAYFTCGGFITQSSIGMSYYPEWIDRFNLRFALRFTKERHYRRRFWLYIPGTIHFFCLLALHSCRRLVSRGQA
ncbi:MAG: WecB/TagA/CpsF family glycosyltransferase [Pseudomonadales bacterium]|nr:WecB/TagA/CpsF family glycosyltransferase [Pseudomonadales bacterium]